MANERINGREKKRGTRKLQVVSAESQQQDYIAAGEPHTHSHEYSTPRALLSATAAISFSCDRVYCDDFIASNAPTFPRISPIEQSQRCVGSLATEGHLYEINLIGKLHFNVHTTYLPSIFRFILDFFSFLIFKNFWTFRTHRMNNVHFLAMASFFLSNKHYFVINRMAPLLYCNCNRFLLNLIQKKFHIETCQEFKRICLGKSHPTYILKWGIVSVYWIILNNVDI